MIDMILKQLEYAVITTAVILVGFEFGGQDANLPIAFTIVGIILYCWGFFVAVRVSSHIRNEFVLAYERQIALHFTAWFCSWLGVVGLLALMHVLRAEARSDLARAQANRS